MAYTEDEVDWSDSPLDHNPAPMSTAHEPTAAVSNAQIAITAHQNSVNPPQPFSPSTGPTPIQQVTQRLQPLSDNRAGEPTRRVGARAQPKIKGQANRRQPTKTELSKFALYQANQRIYEALFLKTFVVRALQPDRLDLKDSLSDNPEVLSKIEGYLQAVSSNVSQITNKMIWNAHFKTTNFLAKDGQDRLPFINVDSFKEGAFRDFGPGNSLPVVQKMNQSWHRIYQAIPMVQHSVANYPIGTHRSPFEDIQEAASQKLLSGKGLSTGRVVKPPTKRNVLPRTYRRDSEASPPHGRRLRSSVPRTPPTVISPISEPTAATEPLPDLTAVADYVSGVVMHDAEPAMDQRHEPEPQNWKTRLVNEHKRSLAKMRVPSQRYTGPMDIKNIVAYAVERDVLQPPSAMAQRIINRKVMAQTAPVVASPPLARDNPSSCPRPGNASSPKSVGKKRKRACPAVPGVQHGPVRGAPSVAASPHSTRLASSSCPRPKNASPSKSVSNKALPLHPSGSKTLEPNQILPKDAYFESADPDEQPVWRCGVKHAMGHYYNAGNRKNCVGCFTHVSDGTRHKWMDFYLPSMSHFFQPTPDYVWKPSKDFGKERKCTHKSHNSIAKDAYWEAIAAGANEDEARQKAVEAVQEHLRPPAPTPEPTPEPVPGPIDLGPHPSGSATMEHGQDIPDCHYFKERHKDENFAWRCDVTHALGRYYMARDKATCPGCGSSINGDGRKVIMDFYMPPGTVVRQEAPGLFEWHPKDYKSKKQNEKLVTTHNQYCTKKYLAAIREGQNEIDALDHAVKETDAWLDAKNEEVLAKREEAQERRRVAAERKRENQEKRKRKAEEKLDQKECKKARQEGQTASFVIHERNKSSTSLGVNSDGGMVISLTPRNRGLVENSASEYSQERDLEIYEQEEEASGPEMVEISSADESSSSSDSE